MSRASLHNRVPEARTEVYRDGWHRHGVSPAPFSPANGGRQ